MANAGFQIINDHLTTLIDSNYANLALIDSGTVAVASNTAADGYAGGVTLNNPRGGLPLIFISCTGFVNIHPVYPGSFGYRMATGVTSFKWWAFAPPNTSASGPGQGLQVFDANGNCTFDSSLKYLRVAEVLNGTTSGLLNPTNGGVGNINSYPMSAGSANRAFCFGNPGYALQMLTWSTGYGWRNIACVGGRFNGTAVEAAAFQNTTNLAAPSGSYINGTQAGKFPNPIIVADVTGM